MIDEIFRLENVFKDWIVSIELITGYSIVLGINLIGYLKA